MRDSSMHSDLIGAVNFILDPNETIQKILKDVTPPSALLQNLITSALKDDWPVRKTFEGYGKLYREKDDHPQDVEISQLIKKKKKTVFPAAKLRMPEKLRGLFRSTVT